MALDVSEEARAAFASRPRRPVQLEELVPLPPQTPPEAPAYSMSTPRLKKFGGDMKNISYPEMVQLSETLAFHLHQVTGVTVGPHDLASAFFKTVETMDALPTEKPVEAVEYGRPRR
ncbi:hypothetical protein J2J97_32555 (plasmid) [Rhizobium bangladeshense]|uniref:hypothetical protein n=1 Tax=Rhizobium bangladeshense TaxID=1138189 RepID=UPI001A97FBBF|nr:hypothetical protein [Rhizobium bangladeshense]QSY98637.1 hypothetical protein J2J97_32555 [Rhizobium bangladeshense]